jgi:hypothetical protein
MSLTPTYPLALGGYTFSGYTAFYTLVLNLVVAVVLTAVFNAVLAPHPGTDETTAADYHALARSASVIGPRRLQLSAKDY